MKMYVFILVTVDDESLKFMKYEYIVPSENHIFSGQIRY